MTLVWLLPPVAAFLLLAAHFFRADNLVATIVSVLSIGLLFVRRPWAARAAQVALAVGAAEWLRVAITLAAARSAAGQPFARLAIILGAACLFTALAALVFRTKALRVHFRSSAVPADADAPPA